MLLYHGSNVIVKNPKIIKVEKGRDFGFAFYLTPIKAQAERMAKRKAKISLTENKKAFVSIFEWNEKDIKDIKTKEFKDADSDWLDMVLNCRSNANYKHEFDIVIGKIADDNVGETINYVLDKVIKKEDAIERLKFQKSNLQIAFCSDLALKKLHFVDSYEVEL